MLTIERLRLELRGLRTLPTLVRLGLLVLAFGGVADVVAHFGLPTEAGELHEHAASESMAHLIGFVGMVLVLLGVVVDGARRSRVRRSADHT
jgi:hypothetical protein